MPVQRDAYGQPLNGIPGGQPGGGKPHTITIGDQTFVGRVPNVRGTQPYYTSPVKGTRANPIMPSPDPIAAAAPYTSMGNYDPHVRGMPSAPPRLGASETWINPGTVIKGRYYEGYDQSHYNQGEYPGRGAGQGAIPPSGPGPGSSWKMPPQNIPGAGNALAPAPTPAIPTMPGAQNALAPTQQPEPAGPSMPKGGSAPSINNPVPAMPSITPSSTVGGSLAAIVGLFPEGSPARSKLQGNLDRFLADPRGGVVGGLTLSEIGTLFRGLQQQGSK